MTAFMKRSTLGPMSAKDKARRDACVAAGCEACHQLGLPKAEHCGAFEFHHLLQAGQRLGHRWGVSLGDYHHRGRIPPGRTLEEMQDKYGPNLADDKRGFHAQFGSDTALLNGQDDRIGHPRENIPSKREQRLSGNAPARRKPSATARPIKAFHREDLA
jgi:hypothetical protein